MILKNIKTITSVKVPISCTKWLLINFFIFNHIYHKFSLISYTISIYTWTQHVICSPCKTDLATACRFMSHPWTLIDMPCLYTSCSSGSRARVAEYVRARLTLSTKACLATMPETPHGYFGPVQISGTLTAQDREAIWRQTECSVSVRARKNKPRVLTINGPKDKLPEARVMALRFIDANEVAQDLPPGGQPFAGSEERWCAGQRRRLEVEKHRQHRRV